MRDSLFRFPSMEQAKRRVELDEKLHAALVTEAGRDGVSWHVFVGRAIRAYRILRQVVVSGRTVLIEGEDGIFRRWVE